MSLNTATSRFKQSSFPGLEVVLDVGRCDLGGPMQPIVCLAGEVGGNCPCLLVGRMDCPEIKSHGPEEIDVEIEAVVVVMQIYLSRIGG
jgi:hypothetical protein